ncbi:uncharacterized protein LOC143465407 isoform X2 [Clavelina lepadiformis]|uniref:uncharacterized protein LOC143465407 isoform X2 n=1 Tax=Clavelina lepadiformis TaxID=159417 RepID=UPI004041A2AC
MQQQNMAELEDLTSLQNEFESLKSEVQDSERISAELRTSLETEKQRSQETLSALKQEQKRNLELTAMVELSCNEAEKLKRQIDTLRMSLRAVNKMLTITEDERKELEEQKMKEMRRKAQREELEKLVNPYYPNDNTVYETINVEEKPPNHRTLNAIERDCGDISQTNKELTSKQLSPECDDILSTSNSSEVNAIEAIKTVTKKHNRTD